jgi:hypothetical protein
LPFSFWIINVPNSNKWLSLWITLQKNMLVELWVGNYATLEDLVNGGNDNFHYYIVQFVQNHWYG